MPRTRDGIEIGQRSLSAAAITVLGNICTICMGVAISLGEILTAGIIALTDRSVIQIAFTIPIAIAITVVERYKFELVTKLADEGGLFSQK
jgi:hypothetical protein